MKIKRKGERGLPFLMPCEGEKGMQGDTLTRMEKNAVEKRDNTHLIQESEKPKACRVCQIYC